MWILFALTSATILASRKIQEKKLVGDARGSLAWMIRFGSAIATVMIWLIFSRDLTGITDWRLWGIIAIIALVVYPIQWVLGAFAISWTPNPGYTTALINSHAILTALYGVFILRESVTPKKIAVFVCMLVALLSFMFA